MFLCLLLSCIVLLLAHGRPNTLPLRVDVSCGDVRVTGGWNRLQEGVRTVCVPSAWTAVYFLLSGKTRNSFIVSLDIVFFMFYFFFLHQYSNKCTRQSLLRLFSSLFLKNLKNSINIDLVKAIFKY